ncbi:MAG: hypothetical protein IPI57_18915 [Candidatus Competibacteraceae bacterium]|nr:hypothetical protein [Candidatus Competibacteraceae bacterium]
MYDDREFLAAVASHEIAAARKGLRATIGEFLEYRIARQMSELVVDLLEVVQIGHQQASGLTGKLVEFEGALQLLVERLAVVQPSQGVQFHLPPRRAQLLAHGSQFAGQLLEDVALRLLALFGDDADHADHPHGLLLELF